MFYFPYNGNKRREIKYVDEAVTQLIESGQINKIVEPFCGSGALSFFFFKKYGDRLEYHLNDNDDMLVKFLHEVKRNGSRQFFEYVNTQCEGLTVERFKEIIAIGKEGRSMPEWFFSYKVYGTRQYMPPIIGGKRKYGGYQHSKYENMDAFFGSDSVHLTHGDYEDILEKFKDDPKALIFIDPPYMDSYNRDYMSHKGNGLNKDREMRDMTKVYVDIAELLENDVAKVLTIQNSNHITRRLYRGYLKKEYGKLYTLTRKRTNHAIFCNFGHHW
jgi:site-specific DNA-adenine methylase